MSKIAILGNGLLGTELQNQSGWDLISRENDFFDITFYQSLLDFLIL